MGRITTKQVAKTGSEAGVANNKKANFTTSMRKRLWAYGLHSNRPVPFAKHFIACSNWFAFCPLHFVIAILESTKFVFFVFPLSNPQFCNRDPLWPAKPSISSHLISNQRVRRPAASFSRSRHQVEVYRARAESMWKQDTESTSF